MAVTRMQSAKKPQSPDSGATRQRVNKARKKTPKKKAKNAPMDSGLPASPKSESLSEGSTAAVKPANLLMRLPGELRNKIYRLVLKSPTPLEVHKDEIPKQPALTRVSRQIRKEALAIFYRENVFETHIRNNDFSHDWTWLAQIGRENRELIVSNEDNSNRAYYTFSWSGDPTDSADCWKNLLQWLKKCYQYKANCFRESEGKEERTCSLKILDTLSRTAKQLRDNHMPWKTAERVLTDMAEMAECAPPGWKPETD